MIMIESLKFMLSKNKYTYDPNLIDDFSDFQFISSWEMHYRSWLNNKIFPIKLVKYEDLINKIKEFVTHSWGVY